MFQITETQLLELISLRSQLDAMINTIKGVDKKDKNPREIANEIALYFDVSPTVVMSRKQTPDVALIRRFIWKFLRDEKLMTLKEIGLLFDRNHATIHGGISKLNDDLDFYKQLKIRYLKLVKDVRI